MVPDEAPISNNVIQNDRDKNHGGKNIQISNTIEMRPVYSPNEDINTEIPSSTDICFDIPGKEFPNTIIYVKSYCNNSA